MDPGLKVTTFAAVVALAVGLLAWIVIDTGTTTLARYRDNFTARAKFQVQEFFLFIDPRKLYIANLAVMTLGGVAAWLLTGSVLLSIPLFFALALMPQWVYGSLRRRRLRRFEEQLPEALLTSP